MWSWDDLRFDQRACSITCMHINAIYSVYASACECTQFYAFLLVPIDAGLDYTCVWAVLSICEAVMTASVTSVLAASHWCTWITFSDGGSAISSWSQNRWEINLQKQCQTTDLDGLGLPANFQIKILNSAQVMAFWAPTAWKCCTFFFFWGKRNFIRIKKKTSAIKIQTQ